MTASTRIGVVSPNATRVASVGIVREVESFNVSRNSCKRSRFVFRGRVLPSFEGICRELTHTLLLLCDYSVWHGVVQIIKLKFEERASTHRGR